MEKISAFLNKKEYEKLQNKFWDEKIRFKATEDVTTSQNDDDYGHIWTEFEINLDWTLKTDIKYFPLFEQMKKEKDRSWIEFLDDEINNARLNEFDWAIQYNKNYNKNFKDQAFDYKLFAKGKKLEIKGKIYFGFSSNNVKSEY